METSNTILNGKRRMILVALLITSVLLLSALAGCTPRGNRADSSVRTSSLSEPLNGATTAKFDINTDTGNLTIDGLASDEQVLASGTLQYLEGQDEPTALVTTSNGQATFTLRASDAKQSGINLPWEACNGETEWQIHLNSSVSSDIAAHSGGGNVKLDLTGAAVTRIMADTGGGNMDVTLPGNAANLNVTAKTGAGDVTVAVGSGITGRSTIEASSGAGNVVVRLPDGVAVRIHATSGVGKVIVDPAFGKIDNNTYQSPDYNAAANQVEITINSGAGNVSVNTK